MENANAVQETADERLPKNTGAFRAAYERLNSGEQKEVRTGFCQRYQVSEPAFRARISGYTRVSDTELVWMEKKVATYFPDQP